MSKYNGVFDKLMPSDIAFNYDYFKKFIKSQKYNLIYVAKNQNSSIINYSNLKESISKDCKYLDLLFKLKK